MSDRIELSPFERKIASGHGSVPPCPEPEEFLDLMDQGENHPNAIGLLEHARECADCRRLYLGVQETWHATHPTPVVQPEPSARRESKQTLWQRLFGPSIGFATGSLAVAAILLLVVLPTQINQVESKLERQQRDFESQSSRAKQQIVDLKSRQPSVTLTPDAAVKQAEESGLSVLTIRQDDSGQKGEGSTDLPPIDLQYPVSQTVLDARPEFQWKHVKGATYDIAVVNRFTYDPLAQESSLRSNKWQPPKDLPREVELVWTVIAKKGSHVAATSSGRFRVLSAAKSARIKRASETALLARGVVLAREGVLDEAEKAFREVLRTAPGNKNAARWLRDIQSKWASARK